MRKFFRGLKADWNKIVWSDKKAIIRETAAVIVFSTVLCAFIVGVDTLTQYSVNFISSLIG